jgi:hypothetical protein
MGHCITCGSCVPRTQERLDPMAERMWYAEWKHMQPNLGEIDVESVTPKMYMGVKKISAELDRYMYVAGRIPRDSGTVFPNRLLALASLRDKCQASIRQTELRAEDLRTWLGKLEAMSEAK